MQKKTPSLKLVVPLLTFLVIVGTALAGSLSSTLADSLSRFSSSPLCVGHNNSHKPNSDCNTNTPDPLQGSCQLAWTNGGGGTVALDARNITDKALHSTLGGYNLRCAADVKVSSCTLVTGNGNTKLDLANIINRSPWIYKQLINDKFSGLNCNKQGASTSTNDTNSPNKYFYIVSALGSRYVDTLNGQTNPGKDGIPIVADKKNNSPTDSQLWKFVPVFDKKNDGYGYFQSKSNLFLDIKHGQTTAGAPVIAFTKNPSESDNQLWKFVSDGKNGGKYGYLQSKSNLVLDIPGSSPDLSKPLIAFSQDQSISPNQIWTEVPQS